MRRRTQGKHVAVRRQGVKLSRATVAVAVTALVASLGITAVGVAPAEASVVKPFTLGYDQDVYGDFLEVGNGSMRCPNPTDPTDPSSTTPIASCAPGQSRGNTTVNDNYFMRWADVDADGATFSSSAAQLTIPAGADVEFARLNWAGNTGRIKTTGTSYSAIRGCSTRQITYGTSSPVPAGAPATTPVRLTVGAAPAVPITGVVTVDPAAAVPNNSPEYYSAFADVTSAFAGAATGAPLTIGVGNVWAPEGFNCFGGWSLVLVYSYDEPNANAPLKRSVQIYDGHVRQANGEAPTGVTLTGIRAATSDVRVGVTAYEGDYGIAGDQFQINGTSVVEPSPGGVATNFFVSDADGASSPSVANNFSVDAKQIVTTLIPSGSQTASLNFVTTGDSYLAQNLVLSVPIPDLSMTKVPSATAARPGDSVTFTITATNPTPVGLTSVQVSDPQYPQCDRNIGNLAGNSSFQYTCSVVAGAGDLTNTATGSGTDTFGDTITDTVTSPTVDVVYPGVDVTKTLDPATPGPFAPGATVTFDLRVENTGDSPLTDVTVTDPAVPACERTFATLAAGAVQTWSCSTTAPVAGRTNTARVNATDASGQNVIDVDDAVAPNAASVNGRVFVDADGDGAFGAADSGIGGVTVDLVGTDENGVPVSLTTTTTAAGLWFFEGLVAGTYTVTEVQPPGYTDGTDTPGGFAVPAGNDAFTVTLPDGEVSTGNLFAEAVTGSVSGVSFVDLDDDGVQDAGEPGLAGVRIDLAGVDSAGRVIALTTFTDATGAYTFANLRPATYDLVQTQPTGYVDGEEAAGTAGGAVTGPDSITGIVLATADQAATGYTFGDLPAAVVSGVVRSDTGGPIAGVTVTLTGTDDRGQAVSVAVVTAADGSFVFADLRPGTYQLVETQPAGYGPGSATAGPSGGTATQPDTISGITVVPGQQHTGHVFVDDSASVAGSVYEDLDGDGVRDPGEPGLAGVQVIVSGTDVNGPVSAVATTDATGAYLVDGLLAGTYTVLQPTQPAGYLDGREAAGTAGGTPNPPDQVTGVVLTQGQDATGYTFGEVRPASLAGAVTAGGAGVPGVTITLTGTNDLGQPVSTTVQTASDGSWSFPGLRPGTYTVTETQPAGYLDGPDTAGTAGGAVGNDVVSGIVLGSGTAATGYLFTETAGSLSGSVYVDADADGVRDGGEAGIAGVTVTLTGTTAGGVAVNRTTTTAADGSWTFAGVPGGTYAVTETQPAGYLDGIDAAGSAGGTSTAGGDSITAITLDPAEDATGYTFGEVLASGISGTVTSDQGTPLPGVTITLSGIDDLGNPVTLTTTTGSTGAWAFPGLRPGTYTVTETQPVGYGAGAVTPGTSGGTVATPDQVTGIVLAPGAAATGYAFVDTTGSLAGSVFADADADGVRDAGESGLGGVTVTLTGTDANGAAVSLTTTSDATTGAYAFDGLLSGTYTVTETQPAGYLDGREAVGTAGGTAGPGADEITVITLEPGEDATGYTFGEVLGSGLSGTVVDDRGRPLAGVTVTLTGTDDLGNPVTVVVVTGPTGTWAFTDVRPGTYAVTETQPAGYGTGTSTAGTAGGTATPNAITGIVLAPGTSGTGYVFVDATGSLAGAVYVDANGNGLRDADEPGIGGVEVVLTATAGPAAGLTVTVTTGPDGSWTAVGLVGGTWDVAETQPTLWADGDDTAGTLGGTPDGADTIEGVVLPDGGSGSGYLFGEVGASLAGTVYTDADGDGTRDTGEPGIGGVTVTVSGTDADGAAITPRTTTTAADGSWVVPGLPAGTYTVTETQPAGYADGADTVGTAGGNLSGPDSVTGVDLAAGEAAVGYEFGELLGAVTGTVFLDADRDGVRDAGEAGIGGVTVTLLDADGDVVATTTTAADGTYAFTDLAPGDYTVVEGQPTGYGSSTPNGVDVTVTGTSGAVVDFGDTLGTIGDRVWSDENRNGVQDAGEPGVGGVTVELLGAGGAVVATTTTAADGSYEFAVVAGTYQVRLVLPAGTTVTQPGAGSDGAVDSDVVQAALTSGPVTLAVTAGGAVQDVDDVDAGLVPVERDLSVTITPDRGTVAPGGEVVWTVVVTNEGTVPEVGAVVTVTVPAGVDVESATGDGWTCTTSATTVTCTTTATVPPGAQAPPITVVTTVTGPGDATLTAVVAPADGSSDAVPANDTDSAVVDVVVAAAPVPPGTRPGDGRLPRTGSEPAPWLGVATLLMAAGTAMVVGSRRRRGVVTAADPRD